MYKGSPCLDATVMFSILVFLRLLGVVKSVILAGPGVSDHAIATDVCPGVGGTQGGAKTFGV